MTTAAADGTTAVVTAASEAEKSTEQAKSGDALEDAVEANSEAQDYKEDTKPVKAQIVKQEPAVMIASGTGDVDTAGELCDTPYGWIYVLARTKTHGLHL